MASTNPYDTRKLSLPAIDINDAHTTVNNHVTDMINSISAISDAITNIPWDGISQQDMEHVYDRWSAAITNLLGTEKDPSKGSMNIVLVALAQAARNYAQAETQLQTAFNKMAVAISANSSGAAASPTSVLVHDNGDKNAPSTFVEEIYSDDGAASGEGPWTISG